MRRKTVFNVLVQRENVYSTKEGFREKDQMTKNTPLLPSEIINEKSTHSKCD